MPYWLAPRGARSSSPVVSAEAEDSVCMLPAAIGKTLYFTNHLYAICMPWKKANLPSFCAYVPRKWKVISYRREKHFLHVLLICIPEEYPCWGVGYGFTVHGADGTV